MFSDLSLKPSSPGKDVQIIKDLLAAHIKPVYKEDATSFISFIDEAIQRFAKQIFDQFKATAAERKTIFFNIVANQDFVTFDESLSSIKAIFQLRYGLSLDFSENLFGLSRGRHSLFPAIFDHKKNMAYHVTVCWELDNQFLYAAKAAEINEKYAYSAAKESDCLWQAALKQQDTDVVFIVQKESLFAHSQIIKIKSDHFNRALNAGMKESQTKTIEIEGFSPLTFKLFLEFIYTGTLAEIDSLEIEDFVELLKAGHFYQASNVTNCCIDQINKRLPKVDCLSSFTVIFDLGLTFSVTYEIQDFIDFCLLKAENVEPARALLMLSITQQNFPTILPLVKAKGYKKIEKALTTKAVELLMNPK